jgi:hypothetical protein
MSIKQGPRIAGMRTTANGVSRRHGKLNIHDILAEAAA